MPIKNPTDLLIGAAKYPLAVEGMLPEGAPKLSAMMADVAVNLPTLPNFPIELPDMPAAPTLPAIPGIPGGIAPPTELRRFVNDITTGPAAVRAAAPAVAPMVAPVGGPPIAPGTVPKARYLM